MTVLPTAAASVPAQAFRLMELEPISAFADDTPQARDAAGQYPVALQMVLENTDWSFASRLASLPELAAVALDPDLPHSYALPGDCVALREVMEPGVRWRLDADGLRADVAGPLRVRYTARVTDEVRMPATVRTLLALQLAALLAPRWMPNRAKIEGLEVRLDRALTEARRSDARTAGTRRADGRDIDTGWRGGDGDWVTEATW
jgi:hypothetical protein